eukprot:jgi/Tetstr1/424938/TSEL_015431.t1
MALPLAGTVASPELNATLARLKQHQNKASGIIKHNTNAVKSTWPPRKPSPATTSTRAIARSPRRPRRQSSQPSKLAAGVLARGRGGARAGEGGGPFGSRASRHAAVAQ